MVLRNQLTQSDVSEIKDAIELHELMLASCFSVGTYFNWRLTWRPLINSYYVKLIWAERDGKVKDGVAKPVKPSSFNEGPGYYLKAFIKFDDALAEYNKQVG